MANQQPHSEPSKSLTQNVAEGIQQAASNLKQYGQEVISGEQFKENFFTDTGVFDKWLAHGFTEVANVWLHGHAAPMYTHIASPDGQLPTEQPQHLTVEQPTIDTTAGESPPSIIDQHLGDIGITLEEQLGLDTLAPEMTPTQPSNPSLIDQHLQDVRQATPDLPQPEMELEK